MKARIVDNNGRSNYVIAVENDSPILAAELEKVDKELTTVQNLLYTLYDAYYDAKEKYDQAMESIGDAADQYNSCLSQFSYDDCLSEKYSECSGRREECRDRCYDGDESLSPCLQRCNEIEESCRESARISCLDQWIAHQSKCKTAHSAQIAAAQADALKWLSATQAASERVSEWEVKKTSLAVRKNQLSQIQGPKNYSSVCAQYDDTLQPGTEVDVIPYLQTAYYITTIKSADTCKVDARVFPSGHTFINAALATGAETWHPTYRRGTVKGHKDDGKLKVELDPGGLPGTLGTAISKRGIICNPPKAYFDGDWQTIESAIDAAREALDAAQAALTQLYEDRQACIDSWDQSACYDPAQAQCEATWGQWLIDCGESEACIQAAQEGLQSCLEAALADCDEARQAHVAECFADSDGSIRDAEQAVSEAQSALRAALARIQRPADPLELDLPVAHCSPATYEIGDRVLIDFPTRSASSTNPMAVWESARVIGWVEDPRRCALIYLTKIETSERKSAWCEGHPLNTEKTWTLGDAYDLFADAFEGRLIIQYAAPDTLTGVVNWQTLEKATQDEEEVYYTLPVCGENFNVFNAPRVYINSPTREPACERQIYAELGLAQTALGEAQQAYTEALYTCSQAYPSSPELYAACIEPTYTALLAAIARRDEAQEVQHVYDEEYETCRRTILGAIPIGTDLSAPSSTDAGYWGILFSGYGYVSCDSNDLIYGQQIQKYRITAQDVVIGELTMRYVGIANDGSGTITQVQTDAILSPDITLGAYVPTPIVGLGAPPPDPAP